MNLFFGLSVPPKNNRTLKEHRKRPVAPNELAHLCAMFQFYLYPLKTLENLWFSNFFKGYANGILAQDRLKELEQFFFLGFITKVHCCSI